MPEFWLYGGRSSSKSLQKLTRMQLIGCRDFPSITLFLNVNATLVSRDFFFLIGDVPDLILPDFWRAVIVQKLAEIDKNAIDRMQRFP